MSQGDVWRKRSRRTEVDVALSDESGEARFRTRSGVCVLEVSSHKHWGEILEQCGWRGDERVG